MKMDSKIFHEIPAFQLNIGSMQQFSYIFFQFLSSLFSHSEAQCLPISGHLRTQIPHLCCTMIKILSN